MILCFKVFLPIVVSVRMEAIFEKQNLTLRLFKILLTLCVYCTVSFSLPELRRMIREPHCRCNSHDHKKCQDSPQFCSTAALWHHYWRRGTLRWRSPPGSSRRPCAQTGCGCSHQLSTAWSTCQRSLSPWFQPGLEKTSILECMTFGWLLELWVSYNVYLWKNCHGPDGKGVTRQSHRDFSVAPGFGSFIPAAR